VFWCYEFAVTTAGGKHRIVLNLSLAELSVVTLSVTLSVHKPLLLCTLLVDALTYTQLVSTRQLARAPTNSDEQAWRVLKVSKCRAGESGKREEGRGKLHY